MSASSLNSFGHTPLHQAGMLLRVARPWSRRLLSTSVAPSRVLFFGTDDFSLPSLEKLHALTSDPNSSLTSVDVVTTGDVRRTPKAKPTPVPVKKFALENNITVHEIPTGLSPMDLEHNWTCPVGFDLGVVVSFGYFVPKPVLSSLRLGAINVHPSLLPAYRGAAPISWTVLRGDDETGVSIIEVDPDAFDSGGILLQVEEPVHPDEMYSELRKRLSMIGADCLVAALRNMELGMRPNMQQQQQQQQSSSATTLGVIEETPAWKLTQRHGRVRWRTKYDSKIKKKLSCGTSFDLNDPPTSRQLYNRWRALSESVGVWLDWLQEDRNTTIQLRVVELGFPEKYDVEHNDSASRLTVEVEDKVVDEVSMGTMIWCKKTKRLMLKCAPSASEDWTSDRYKEWIEIKRVQIPGKKVLNGVDFANGQRLKKRSMMQTLL